MSLFILFYFRVVFLQTDTVQALRGDPDSSEAEHARIMLVQTEVERVKFVVRSYIRTRLYKVTHLPSIAARLLWLMATIHRLKSLRGTLCPRPRHRRSCRRRNWTTQNGTRVHFASHPSAGFSVFMFGLVNSGSLG